MLYTKGQDGKVIQYDGENASELELDPETWPQFRKTKLTRAARIKGPFTVDTSEGPLKCEDGWLCVDARGYPYPVASEEFELIYEPA